MKPQNIPGIGRAQRYHLWKILKAVIKNLLSKMSLNSIINLLGKLRVVQVGSVRYGRMV